MNDAQPPAPRRRRLTDGAALPVLPDCCNLGTVARVLLPLNVALVLVALVAAPDIRSVPAVAMRAGVDWLEAGTPLILAEGLHGVRALRAAFPDTPIVADLKTMDGGYLEAEMMAKADYDALG